MVWIVNKLRKIHLIYIIVALMGLTACSVSYKGSSPVIVDYLAGNNIKSMFIHSELFDIFFQKSIN